jgi:periplasmic copper chaperone A
MAEAVPSRVSSAHQILWSSTSVSPVTRRLTLLGSAWLAALALATLFVPSLLIPAVASAHDVTAGALTIQHPWARATAASARTGALYVTVTNNGTESDRLLGVSTEIAAQCEMHVSETTGGMMTMRMVEDLEIPAGGSVTLAPSGTHVMMMGLKAPLQKGTTFPATLRFEKAGEVAVEVTVQGIADLEPAD